jgi:hypothetical protein
MTITERTATMIIGDWGYDGSGLTNSIRVKLRGEDVSNEALSVAKDRAIEATQVDVNKLFEDYEDCTLDYDDFMKLYQNGFRTNPMAPEYLSDGFADYPIYMMDDGDYSELIEEGLLKSDLESWEARFDVVELLMFFLGFEIRNFSYKVVPDDFIVGRSFGPNGLRSNPVINSFGYGLISNG